MDNGMSPQLQYHKEYFHFLTVIIIPSPISLVYLFWPLITLCLKYILFQCLFSLQQDYDLLKAKIRWVSLMSKFIEVSGIVADCLHSDLF